MEGEQAWSLRTEPHTGSDSGFSSFAVRLISRFCSVSISALTYKQQKMILYSLNEVSHRTPGYGMQNAFPAHSAITLTYCLWSWLRVCSRTQQCSVLNAKISMLTCSQWQHSPDVWKQNYRFVRFKPRHRPRTDSLTSTFPSPTSNSHLNLLPDVVLSGKVGSYRRLNSCLVVVSLLHFRESLLIDECKAEIVFYLVLHLNLIW